jgi:hypothetical protein
MNYRLYWRVTAARQTGAGSIQNNPILVVESGDEL